MKKNKTIRKALTIAGLTADFLLLDAGLYCPRPQGRNKTIQTVSRDDLFGARSGLVDKPAPSLDADE